MLHFKVIEGASTISGPMRDMTQYRLEERKVDTLPTTNHSKPPQWLIPMAALYLPACSVTD